MEPAIDEEDVMPPPTTHDDSGVTLKQLLDALRDNGRSAQEDRRQIQQKMDDLARNINDIRREQQAAIENLRRDFERLFVPRAEYDPKHEVVLEKIKQYDILIASSRTNMDDFIRYKTRIDNLEEDFEELKTQRQGTVGKAIQVISVVLAVASVILAYAQHVVIR